MGMYACKGAYGSVCECGEEYPTLAGLIGANRPYIPNARKFTLHSEPPKFPIFRTFPNVSKFHQLPDARRSGVFSAMALQAASAPMEPNASNAPMGTLAACVC